MGSRTTSRRSSPIPRPIVVPRRTNRVCTPPLTKAWSQTQAIILLDTAHHPVRLLHKAHRPEVIVDLADSLAKHGIIRTQARPPCKVLGMDLLLDTRLLLRAVGGADRVDMEVEVEDMVVVVLRVISRLRHLPVCVLEISKRRTPITHHLFSSIGGPARKHHRWCR